MNILSYLITNVQYNANITTIPGFPLHCVQAPWFAGGPGFASPSVWRQFTAPKGIQDLLMWCDKCGIFVCCKVMGYYLKKSHTSPTWTNWNVQKRSHKLHRMKSSGRGRGVFGRFGRLGISFRWSRLQAMIIACEWSVKSLTVILATRRQHGIIWGNEVQIVWLLVSIILVGII